MPSPIIHLTAGYVVYRVARQGSGHPTRPDALLLTAALGLALLPDFDSVLGILLGDFGRYHNSQSHSLLVGGAVALAAGLVLRAIGHRRPLFWAGVTLACYVLHVILDYFTWGRGVMAWWPVTDARFSSPIRLFHGLHWSEGFISPRHLITVASEVPVAMAALALVRALTRRGKLAVVCTRTARYDVRP